MSEYETSHLNKQLKKACERVSSLAQKEDMMSDFERNELNKEIKSLGLLLDNYKYLVDPLNYEGDLKWAIENKKTVYGVKAIRNICSSKGSTRDPGIHNAKLIFDAISAIWEIREENE